MVIKVRCIKVLTMQDLQILWMTHLCNVMISYNNHPDIVHRFEEWYQYDFAHTYTMRSTGTYMIDQTKRRELICLNYGKYRSQSIA